MTDEGTQQDDDVDVESLKDMPIEEVRKWLADRGIDTEPAVARVREALAKRRVANACDQKGGE